MKLRLSPQTKLVLAHFLGGADQWNYGYDISRSTGLKSGSLYPILMRLSELGLLESRWELEGNSKPRHMYRLTADGKRYAKQTLARAARNARLKFVFEGGSRA